MGKDYIVGEVYVEYNDPIYDVAFPKMSGGADFQVFEDLDAVRWSGEPEARFYRLPNGMYLHKGDKESRFWYDVYTALDIRNRQPGTARYLRAGRERDAQERELKKRGGGVMVRGGDDPAGVMYYHDEMLKDLGALIVKAIADPNRKASERRSPRCVCTPAAKRRTPRKR